MSKDYSLSLRGEAFNSLCADFDTTLRDVLAGMIETEQNTGEINIKVKITLTDDSAPDYTVAGGHQTREVTKPKFDHTVAYSTLHNHPGDTDSCFSDTDVRSFANADEQVMYMTSKTKLYSLQKTSDYDGYSARSVATHLESLEKKYQDGDMTRNDLIAETDLYLQLHAHEYGLVYKQQEVDGK